MHYSNFVPDPPSPEELADSELKYRAYQENIRKYAEENNYTPLKCNTFGIYSYFYDHKHQLMYKIHNFPRDSLVFEVSTEEHILRLNHLKG